MWSGSSAPSTQSLSMEVAKSVEDGIEDFARFLSIERRSRCCGCRTRDCFKRREYPSVEQTKRRTDHLQAAGRTDAEPGSDADRSGGTGGACGDNERTKAVGSDRPFDDDQGRDSRTGGTAGGRRGGGTAGIAEPADGGTGREGAGGIYHGGDLIGIV